MTSTRACAASPGSSSTRKTSARATPARATRTTAWNSGRALLAMRAGTARAGPVRHLPVTAHTLWLGHVCQVKFVCCLAVAFSLNAQPAPFLNINPSWSPDGKRLVFQSERHGHTQLYVIDADGTAERRLTRNGAEDTHPAWSPDGEWILF